MTCLVKACLIQAKNLALKIQAFIFTRSIKAGILWVAAKKVKEADKTFGGISAQDKKSWNL